MIESSTRALDTDLGARPPANIRLEPAQRAAVILSILGPQSAAPLLRDLPAERIRTFAKTVADMSVIPQEAVEEVIEEFLSEIEGAAGLSGGREETRKFLAAIMEPDQVTRLMEEIDTSSEAIWKALSSLDDELVLSWIKGEHPQIAALALSQMSSDKSARLLERFPEAEAQALVLRMSKAATAPAAITSRVSDIIAKEVLPIFRMRAERMNPAEMVATIMNHVGTATRETILGGMAETAPDLEAEVRKIMFTFEDIPERIAPRDVGLIVKAVDEARLLIAIKASGDQSPTGEHILGNITKRLAERMRGDLADMPAPKTKDGETAQAEVVAAIVQMRDSGALSIQMPDD